MTPPKITIITPSFNQGQYIEETILSVLDQNYPNLEYIIIDGGSKDNSPEIIRKYEKHLTYWVSEKDQGQSDAINKGLKKTTGDLFNWLNSDDYLEKDALSKVANAYLENTDSRAFCFGLSHLTENNKISFNQMNNTADIIQCLCDPVITQQSTFYHKKAIEQFDKVNVNLHYCMDYEWWLKFIFLYGAGPVYQNKEKIAVFRMHSDSKTSADHCKFVNDIANILYSISMQTNLKEYQALLTKGFSINPSYNFTLQIKETDKEIVKKMIVYFLLKWCHLIHEKEQFYFAKEIMRTLNFSFLDLSDKEQIWLSQLSKDVQYKYWNLFRIKRKIQWLSNR